MAQPIRTRPRFPHSQLWNLPQASYAYPSEGIQNENHSHRKLIKLNTWITALSNSMKLWAMPCRATQDEWVMVESSDKLWSTGEGNGKPFQHSCLRTPHTVWKEKKIWHWKMNFPGQYVPNMLVEKSKKKIAPEGMKRLSPSGNNGQLWICLGGES